MRLRQAEAADVARLLEVERACDGAPHWSESAWVDVLRGEIVERLVLLAEDGDVVGFVVVSVVAGVAEVESVGVVEGARRRGVARALCSTAMPWAQARGAKVIELEVRAGNVAALRLYVGMGFSEQGRRAGYYRDPVEDAVLMRRELGDVAGGA